MEVQLQEVAMIEWASEHYDLWWGYLFVSATTWV